MGKQGSERRQHPRVSLLLRVEFLDQSQVAEATENLSAEGLFILTDREFKDGEEVKLALSFPGLLSPLEVTGRVAWRRPAALDVGAGVGLRVERAEDRAALEKLTGVKEELQASGPPQGGFRILVVEDNPHILEMYGYVLKKMAAHALSGRVPLEVEFAADGHTALQLLLEKTFHLVLTDLYMPIMDGFALIGRIRREKKLKETPVIAISSGGGEDQQKAFAEGANIFLRKPVKFNEVLDTVKKLLNVR